MELHSEDSCTILTAINDDLGSSKTGVVPFCERDTATDLCPPGWLYYQDDGSEGTDSCIQVYTGYTGGWNSGVCGPGAHLLTVKGTDPTKGLTALALSSMPYSAWLGCWQYNYDSAGSWAYLNAVASNWYWVDGTSASNLNCGVSTGGSGCNLWSATEPK